MIKLLPNWIMVEPYQDETTKSGILLPKKADRHCRHLKGKVVSLGEYRYLYYLKDDKKVVVDKVSYSVKIGDKVIFEEARARDYTDTEVTGGKKYYFMEEEIIYAIIK